MEMFPDTAPYLTSNAVTWFNFRGRLYLIDKKTAIFVSKSEK